MRLLVNENVAGTVIRELRKRGCDVQRDDALRDR
jgi:hypothetical protein